jgi:uncharacterized protein involved in response to NO
MLHQVKDSGRVGRYGRAPRPTDTAMPSPRLPLQPAIPIRPMASPAKGGGEYPPSTRADTRWRLSHVTSAPHRLGFCAAAVLLATTAAWWAVALLARLAGVALPWAVPPGVAHGLAFALAFMPLFIVGFLFTAGPRWLGLPDVAARTLVRPVVAMTAGWMVALAGFHTAAWIAGAGLAIAAAGWIAIQWRFLRLLQASRVPDRWHAAAIAAAGSLGALAMAAGALAVATGQTDLARAATQLGIWGFLAPTFAAVSHRMIPFFTASALPSLEAWRPNGLLVLMLATLALTAAGAIAETLWWPLPALAHAALLVVQAPAAVLLLRLAVRWGLLQSLRIRLLAMLHGGFVWLGIAFALAALSHARVLWAGEPAALGLAPLHALTMGYLGATLVAMTTRVAAGHSGRPLAADDLAWALYLVLQTAVLLRVAGALWPAASAALTSLAVVAWAMASIGWAWRYGGWLGRPRVDGRPG